LSLENNCEPFARGSHVSTSLGVAFSSDAWGSPNPFLAQHQFPPVSQIAQPAGSFFPDGGDRPFSLLSNSERSFFPFFSRSSKAPPVFFPKVSRSSISAGPSPLDERASAPLPLDFSFVFPSQQYSAADQVLPVSLSYEAFTPALRLPLDQILPPMSFSIPVSSPF